MLLVAQYCSGAKYTVQRRTRLGWFSRRELFVSVKGLPSTTRGQEGAECVQTGSENRDLGVRAEWFKDWIGKGSKWKLKDIAKGRRAFGPKQGR